jgi:hypothetical protein
VSSTATRRVVVTDHVSGVRWHSDGGASRGGGGEADWKKMEARVNENIGTRRKEKRSVWFPDPAYIHRVS